MNQEEPEHPGSLPCWLYEALPYIYGGIGLLTMLAVRNVLTLISGLLLISAGVIIWKMRHDYRLCHPVTRSRHAHRTTEALPDAAEAHLVQLVWKPAYACGQAELDMQHRRLFGIGNELINAVLAHKPTPDVELLLDELVTHIGEHFRSEEAFLGQTGYPHLDEHRQSHRDMLARANDLRLRFQNGEAVIGDLVGFIAYDVVARHIAQEDRKFAPAEGEDSSPQKAESR